MAYNRLLARNALAAICIFWMATTEIVRAANRSIDESISCLAANIYHEARGESILGQWAVAAVTINRVTDEQWPNTVCEVVWQHAQFSWTEDGLSDETTDRRAYRRARQIAEDVLQEQSSVFPATHYHAQHILPYWAESLTQLGQIGNHIFYK